MERDSTGSAEEPEPVSCRDNISEDTCTAKTYTSLGGTCGATPVAQARWTLLRQVLRQKQSDSPEVKQVSVRRFATFDLFRRKQVAAQDRSNTSDDQWVEYRSVYFPEYSAFLRDNLGPLRVNEVLNSFDNTGNVCVWPSEEVMAHYCLQKRHIFKCHVSPVSLTAIPPPSRCELLSRSSFHNGTPGGGLWQSTRTSSSWLGRMSRYMVMSLLCACVQMFAPSKKCFWFCSFVRCCLIPLSFSCLPGSQVAISADVKEVLLSDGNEKSIQNVRGLLERNRLAGKFGSTHVFSRVVRWDCEMDISALEGHFDVVMCADCLFLDQYRASLVDAVRRLLRPNGTALVFAPLRGETLTRFCQLAQQVGLYVSQRQQYDAQVWGVHLKMLKEGKQVYDENIHYPLLITLTKEPQPVHHAE
ncbi:calmodulin-lysine N-methyltransferase [Nothobranchius furzeri]|uniref:Calmodulin-lysine N-methyltransferase n=2 Tax=Nothobranchius TaxID=28779 RepID=A0A9D2YGK5_NOTFU|nr:calmodulin-lysine N-methyltransferase [Nothobranchius furzeri]